METVSTQPAALIVTPHGQPNIVATTAGADLPVRALLQVQKSFLFSNTFWGNAVAVVGAVGATVALYNSGHLQSWQDVFALFAVGGPLYGIWGRFKAQGPLGLTGTEMVPPPAAGGK